MSTSSFPRHEISGAVLAALALCSTSVLAQDTSEPNPYYIGAAQAFSHDSNVFRAQDGESDIISSTSLLAGLDQPLGRGRVAADLTYTINRFQDQDQLNNNEYNARGRLDWATIERISGDFRAYDRSSLNRYDLESPEGITFKDMVRISGVAAQARIGVVTRWTFDGGAAYDQTRHSASQEENRNLRQGTINGGIRYRPHDLFNVRLGLRYSEGRYYNYGVDPTTGGDIEDKVDRDDIDLSVFWQPTGNSSLNARVSATHENHSQQSARDARTWTGALGYNWIATGKTSFKLELIRDTNAGGSNVDFGLVSDESSDTAGAQFDPCAGAVGSHRQDQRDRHGQLHQAQARQRLHRHGCGRRAGDRRQHRTRPHHPGGRQGQLPVQPRRGIRLLAQSRDPQRERGDGGHHLPVQRHRGRLQRRIRAALRRMIVQGNDSPRLFGLDGDHAISRSLTSGLRPEVSKQRLPISNATCRKSGASTLVIHPLLPTE